MATITRVRYKKSLTGGGTNALDGVPYASIGDDDVAFVIVGGILYFYVFDASSTDAEDVPNVIKPDDAGDNSGRWILQAYERVSYLRDSDGDTTFETERAPDEDVLRGKAGGVDVFSGFSSGIFSLLKQSYTKIKISSAQTIANDSWTKLNYDTADIDIQEEADTVNNRITVKKDGVYLLISQTVFAGNATGRRESRFYKNGLVADICLGCLQAGLSDGNKLIDICLLSLSDSDYIEVYVYQNSGGNLDVSDANLTVVKIH